MRREDFDHLIGAAANVTEEDEFVVIGSQSILGLIPAAPAEFLHSMEVDLYPRAAPDKADLIDATLGDGSMFHRSYGYYAHGAGPDTAKAPAGWEARLERVPIRPRVGSERQPIALCLEVHDLVLAKCAAGRDRDWAYMEHAIRLGLVNPDTLMARVPTMPVDPDRKSLILARVTAARDDGVPE